MDEGDHFVESDLSSKRSMSNKERCPVQPALPDQCTEAVEIVDKDANSNQGPENGSAGEFLSEFVKKDAKFLEGVAGVNMVTSQPKLGQIQRKCQEMAGWEKGGFPGSAPVSMDIRNLNFLRQNPYKVGLKTDGTRYMTLIDGRGEVYMIDRDNTVFQVANLDFPKRKDLSAHIRDTLVDGEMILDMVDGKSVPRYRYLICDILRFEGLEVGKSHLDRRSFYIQTEIIGPRRTKIQQGMLDENVSFSVHCNSFWELTKSKELLEGKITNEISHEVDGLIFQPVSEPYRPGRCGDFLKWKPPELNSVDFRLKIVKENKVGCLPETKGHLFVNGLESAFGEIKMTKELRQLDNKIIECMWDGKYWKYMRQRTDKSFPNNLETAEEVCKSIRNPVTQEMLLQTIRNERWIPSTGDDDIKPTPPPNISGH
ncbi:hypothetical protein LOTGIDRAFT_213203 [Lottia gigantea]|uniref:mRNA guanylyltransferase n=1 Tax=Lottia gigantea TaxID=225164 RepID=V4ARX0_LOTGI|nr:hypothetical protein LOTGIDRAFT_213203 [Lottia gigantea]ESO99997.1 hypothetical protein LOTGIDRAFT_213203 [Lottia gigantea]